MEKYNTKQIIKEDLKTGLTELIKTEMKRYGVKDMFVEGKDMSLFEEAQ